MPLAYSMQGKELICCLGCLIYINFTGPCKWM